MDPQHDWRAVKALEAIATGVNKGMTLYLTPDQRTKQAVETLTDELGRLRRNAHLLRGNLRACLGSIDVRLGELVQEAHRANLLAAADLALRWGSLEEPVRREACRDAVRLLHALWEEWSKPQDPTPREEGSEG